MTTISPPNTTDTRSVLADWLELSALLDERGIASKASLQGLADILEDAAADPETRDFETNEPLDEHILEEGRARFVEIAFEELGYRQSILGDAYPFALGNRNTTLIYRGDYEVHHEGRLIYLFCLLTTALREKKLQIPDDQGAAVIGLANCFQVCACLAAGGYTSGHVASFGWPRASHDAFLPALKNVYRRFGAGTVIDSITPGFDESLKDGGIDVIAWKDHPDKLPGKFYLLGQCASGLGWRGKSVTTYIEGLHGNWFLVKPGTFVAPAMFIPFPIQHELDESDEISFSELRFNRSLYEERTFGIIFDRFRIAHYAKVGIDSNEEMRREIDGFDRLEEVREWVRTATGRPNIAQMRASA